MSGPAGDLVIRPMVAGDDLDAELDLRHRAFGPMNAARREYWLTEVMACIDDGRLYGVWARDTLVGAARFYDMRQWWLGRAVPMAGVAGVKVAPEVRGRGVGRALMTALVAAMASRGYLLTVLYPSTANLYRSVGWEMAGGHYVAEIPGRSLSSLLSDDPGVPGRPGPPGAAAGGRSGHGRPALRRAGPQDAEALISVLGASHALARDCGPCTWDVASARRYLARTDLFGYLADDGFLGYGWAGGHDRINVQYLQAASPETGRALWGLIASHASVTKVVRAAVGPSDRVSWLTREPDVRLRRHKQWMIRVLDAAGAIAGRGFPAAARAHVPLLLADPQVPANAGPATLSIDGGKGLLTPGRASGRRTAPNTPPLRLGPRGLAALYAGVPTAVLRAAGLAAGGDRRSDEALDDAFSCQPYLLDYF